MWKFLLADLEYAQFKFLIIFHTFLKKRFLQIVFDKKLNNFYLRTATVKHRSSSKMSAAESTAVRQGRTNTANGIFLALLTSRLIPSRVTTVPVF